VKRVDVVTGGASAAYGSDAVAGVVNLVLDRASSGMKGDIEGGDSTTVRHRQIKAEFTVGTDILGGRGQPDPERRPHLEQRSGLQQPGRLVRQQRHRPESCRDDVEQPALVLHVRNTGQAQYTQGRPDPRQHRRRRGQRHHRQLADRNPVPQQRCGSSVHFGTVDGTHPNVCYAGCSNSAKNVPGNTILLAVPYHTTTLFGYASYNLTSDIKASIQVNYGSLAEQSTGGTRTSTNTIYADNAFLPSSIGSQFGTPLQRL